MDLKKWDEQTYQHSLRVSRITNRLLNLYEKEYGKLLEEEYEAIIEAGLLHDIGKMMISPAVLAYKGKLDKYMYKIIKKHVEYGEIVLRSYGYNNEYVIKCVLQHHERCDGSGYPRGLFKNDIVLGAKIIAVADSFDALISYRPYRKPFDTKTALRILLSQSYYYNNNIIKLLYKLVIARGGIVSVK